MTDKIEVNIIEEKIIVSNVGMQGAGASDATTTIKGILKLAGDLEGTADLPTVKNASVTSKVLTGLDTSINAVITASDTILSAQGKLQKQITDGLPDYTAENVANKSTDGTLSANSDTLYCSQKATKTFANNISIVNSLIFG